MLKTPEIFRTLTQMKKRYLSEQQQRLVVANENFYLRSFAGNIAFLHMSVPNRHVVMYGFYFGVAVFALKYSGRC